MKKFADTTLMKMTKKELIEHLRIAEDNLESQKAMFEQQYENVKDWEPVVRCKDCKYSRQPNKKDYYENKACKGVFVCVNCPDSVRPEDGGYKFVNSDWFCADGKLHESHL